MERRQFPNGNGTSKSDQDASAAVVQMCEFPGKMELVAGADYGDFLTGPYRVYLLAGKP